VSWWFKRKLSITSSPRPTSSYEIKIRGLFEEDAEEGEVAAALEAVEVEIGV